jgi:hypothetical protein
MKTKSKSKSKYDGREIVIKLIGQIQRFYDEVSVLSKSKPDNPLNAFKLRFINDKLAEANDVLVGDYQPLKGFTVFDDANLPTNSDVVMVLSQYLTRLNAWKSEHRTPSVGGIVDWN